MTKLTKRSYGADWAAKSQVCIRLAGFQCEFTYPDGSRCGVTRDLQSHHLTYENFRKESLTDIQVLCRFHHEKTHGILKAFDE